MSEIITGGILTMLMGTTEKHWRSTPNCIKSLTRLSTLSGCFGPALLSLPT
jgi:hypothetical protein